MSVRTGSGSDRIRWYFDFGDASALSLSMGLHDPVATAPGSDTG